MRLTPELAEAFASIALGHVGREYPNKLDHVLAGPDDVQSPRALHPVFYGSFDWHSCVHAFWMLARLRRRFPALPVAEPIARLFDERLRPDAIAGECAYLDRPASGGFERPYGWAWLLALAAELDRAPEFAWAERMKPLTKRIAERFAAYLPRATRPIRAGVHGNTAFALLIAADYAEATAPPLFTMLGQKALAWYGVDKACQAWEPDGEDFLSPALVEAACMRRFLSSDAFTAWLSDFLPDLIERRPAALFQPAEPSDRTDGRIAHLDGLNFSRAWCWRLIAEGLPSSDRRRAVAEAAAEAHVAHSLPYLAVHYAGEHWLASFATLALDGVRA